MDVFKGAFCDKAGPKLELIILLYYRLSVPSTFLLFVSLTFLVHLIINWKQTFNSATQSSLKHIPASHVHTLSHTLATGDCSQEQSQIDGTSGLNKLRR